MLGPRGRVEAQTSALSGGFLRCWCLDVALGRGLLVRGLPVISELPLVQSKAP